MTPLKWTRTPPTEAGWYFKRATVGDGPRVEVLYYKPGETDDWHMWLEWAGPIAPPEEGS